LINELPPELLAHIFLLGTAEYDTLENEDEEDEEMENEENEDEGDSDNDEGDSEPNFEVLVSHVCRLWRDIALDTPTLWTKLDFSEGLPYERSKIYLERSKNAPLDIYIDVTKDDEVEDANDPFSAIAELMVCSDEMDGILDLVLPHVSHWRVFSLAVSAYVLMNTALVELSKCPAAPMLEVLQLYDHSENEEVDVFEPSQFKDQLFVIFKGNAPKLTTVALWGVHLNWAESRFLTGLVDLELAYHAKDVRPSFKDFARILRESPDIHTLSLCQSGPAGGPVDWLASIVDQRSDHPSQEVPNTPIATLSLPSLKSLVLAFLEPDYATSLIERLAIPNLTSFAIDLEDQSCDDFLKAITRPSPATGKSLLAGLEALKISGLPCEDQRVIADVYAATSNLKSLNINFAYSSEAWYTLLKATSTKTGSSSSSKDMPFLPRLEALTTSGLDGVQVRKLVQARKAMGLPIRRIFMNEDDEMEEDDEKWLAENLDEFQWFEGSDEEEILEIAMSDGEEVDFPDLPSDEDGDEWEDTD